ncbi:MAG: argininosuccinate lyase [Peptostreptococcaceae bacterium]|jgi:argininosuccinate lyase|nr:argininosuccinate lyase [Peptostreptococcaceae bacterium]
MKLWGGRFLKEESNAMNDFNSSFEIDKRFYKEDIKGSLVHAKMLNKQNIITNIEYKLIEDGLEIIKNKIDLGELKLDGDYEDIHSFIEINLINEIGQIGKKIHTARSRNDQVALDFNLKIKNDSIDIINLIKDFIEILVKKADDNPYMMPAYTHLQRAQITTFKYYLKAYVNMFKRDIKRIKNTIDLMDESPLGSGALAGTTHNIDMEFTSKELGFQKPTANFLDAVSNRDFVIEMLNNFSIIMMHLSRLSEEIIIFSSQEFKFVQIDDAYCTGSSIMPHKKNPDSMELVRGKCGRVYGNLMALLTVMKGLPLAYNKDMQEDKEIYFDSLDTIKSCLYISKEVIKTLKFNKEEAKKGIKKGFLNATEVADYLVAKGIAFRDAHEIVGKIIILCEKENKAIEEININELKDINNLIEEDIYEYIDYENILNKGNKKEML